MRDGSECRAWWLSVAVLGAVGFAGCSMGQPSRPQTQQEEDQQIQQKAAQTTQQVKADAKVAAADAKVATANAGRKLKDIAKGVREGLHDQSGGDTGGGDGKPSAGRIDLNSASEEELAALPGVSSSKARQIINGRPYSSSHDLVTKGLLSESRYERVARRVTAR